MHRADFDPRETPTVLPPFSETFLCSHARHPTEPHTCYKSSAALRHTEKTALPTIALSAAANSVGLRIVKPALSHLLPDAQVPGGRIASTGHTASPRSPVPRFGSS